MRTTKQYYYCSASVYEAPEGNSLYLTHSAYNYILKLSNCQKIGLPFLHI